MPTLRITQKQILHNNPYGDAVVSLTPSQVRKLKQYWGSDSVSMHANSNLGTVILTRDGAYITAN